MWTAGVDGVVVFSAHFCVCVCEYVKSGRREEREESLIEECELGSRWRIDWSEFAGAEECVAYQGSLLNGRWFVFVASHPLAATIRSRAQPTPAHHHLHWTHVRVTIARSPIGTSASRFWLCNYEIPGRALLAPLPLSQHPREPLHALYATKMLIK